MPTLLTISLLSQAGRAEPGQPHAIRHGTLGRPSSPCYLYQVWDPEAKPNGRQPGSCCSSASPSARTNAGPSVRRRREKGGDALIDPAIEENWFW